MGLVSILIKTQEYVSLSWFCIDLFAKIFSPSTIECKALFLFQLLEYLPIEWKIEDVFLSGFKGLY